VIHHYLDASLGFSSSLDHFKHKDCGCLITQGCGKTLQHARFVAVVAVFSDTVTGFDKHVPFTF